MRVDAVGICGSDLHSYAEGAVGDTPCEYPMVLGHEPAGTVVKTGSGVTGWQLRRSRRARTGPLLLSLRVLPHRPSQRLRQYPLPEQPRHPGFFREFVNLPVTNLLAIPPGLSLELATIVEPLAVAMHSMKFAAFNPARPSPCLARDRSDC